jgi:flagellar protein FliS
MNAANRALATYGDVMVETGVSGADPRHLVQMLLDGLVDSLNAAEGHMRRSAISEKSSQITRAMRIVLGLHSALDYGKGGEIARNLDELYRYVNRRLLHANARNDIEALREVRSLMSEIREAWSMLPAGTAMAAVN